MHWNASGKRTPKHLTPDATNPHKVRLEPPVSCLEISVDPMSWNPVTHPGRDPRLVSRGTSEFLRRNSLSPKMPKRHQPGTESCPLEATRNM